jgi:uncharacterized GH25 family protein
MSLRLPWMLLAAGVCAPALAHDFWLQPEQYLLRPGEQTAFTLEVGHGPFRQRSPIASGRITRFAALTPSGTMIDLREALRIGGTSNDGDFQFRAPGTYVVVLETDDRAESHLPAIRFNDYLRVEGLTPALEQRERTNRMNADGSENYSRRTKALVHVGAPDAPGDVALTRPVGLPLEILLQRSPYETPRASSLPIQVLYYGQPLAGALVKLTNLEHDEAPVELHRTDNHGQAQFAMPGDGRWLLNVIWTRPSPSTRETDFETVFSSLSFGCCH